jgi:hypothetical protein
MAIEVFANDAESVLDSGIDNAVTTLDVVDASTFPSVPQFRIRIDNELLLVTGVSSNTFTVTRGIEGTTPASHGNGVAAVHVLTKGAREQERLDNNDADAIGNRLSAGRAGALFWPTGGIQVQRDSGSVWDGFGPLYRFKQPPLASAFTFVNQGGSSVADEAGTVRLTAPANNGVSARLLVKSAPATPYVITAAFIPFFDQGTNTSAAPRFGLVFRNSGGNAFKSVNWLYGNSNTFSSTALWFIQSGAWSDVNTFSTGHFTARRLPLNPHLAWLRIADDGADRIYSVSADGVHWEAIYTEANDTGFTANQVGLFLDNQTVTGTVLFNSSLRLVSWEES